MVKVETRGIGTVAKAVRNCYSPHFGKRASLRRYRLATSRLAPFYEVRLGRKLDSPRNEQPNRHHDQLRLHRRPVD